LEFFLLVGNGGAEAWDYSGINVGLIDILGKGYIVESCISLFQKRMEEKLYRVYTTDVLLGIFNRLLPQGNVIKERYYDMITPAKTSEKSGDEIALEVIRKAGLKVKEDG